MSLTWGLRNASMYVSLAMAWPGSLQLHHHWDGEQTLRHSLIAQACSGPEYCQEMKQNLSEQCVSSHASPFSPHRTVSQNHTMDLQALRYKFQLSQTGQLTDGM